MKIIQTNISSVLIIEPRVFKDSRGYFFESFSQREFDEPTNEARAEPSWLELCLARRRKTKGQKVKTILGLSKTISRSRRKTSIVRATSGTFRCSGMVSEPLPDDVEYESYINSAEYV